MAKKIKKRQVETTDQIRRSAAKKEATVGLGAALLAAVTWIGGGISWETVAEWMKTIVIAGGLALTARWAIGEPYKIPSGSMEPTLHGDARFLRGDRVFVNKWIYGLRYPFNHARLPFLGKPIDYAQDRIFRGAKPQRWEIVVFKSVEKNAKHGTLVKRIVGLPGERVLIRDGKIFINGEPLVLPKNMPNIHYTREGRYGVIPTDEYTLVPEDHYFLLGDNSSASRDSRYWGWVPNEHILGRVSCIAWPPNRWRDFTGFSKTLWWRLLVALISLITFWRLFLGQSWKVLDVSPDRELHPGEHLYVCRLSLGLKIPFSTYRLFSFKQLKRGVLVLFKHSDGNQGAGHSLGRIAAFPGEKVQIRDGRLYIDGERIESDPFHVPLPPAANELTALYGKSAAKEYAVVPPNHVFIVCTAGEESKDGRVLGWTPQQDLIGVVKFVWFPLRRIRTIGKKQPLPRDREISNSDI